MDEREFFDRLAPEWDSNEVLSTPEKIDEILETVGLQPGMRVLDLGTGTGVLLPHIARRIGKAGKITAVDYSEGMLSIAEKKFSGIEPIPEFLNIDFENENIEGVYDRIFLYCVYPHLHTPVDTLKWLRRVNLAAGGSIIIAFPTGPDFINNIHRDRHSESDLLPDADTLAKRLREEGLDAKVLKADAGSYVVGISGHEPA